jgi:hypothetical protein
MPNGHFKGYRFILGPFYRHSHDIGFIGDRRRRRCQRTGNKEYHSGKQSATLVFSLKVFNNPFHEITHS